MNKIFEAALADIRMHFSELGVDVEVTLVRYPELEDDGYWYFSLLTKDMEAKGFTPSKIGVGSSADEIETWLNGYEGALRDACYIRKDLSVPLTEYRLAMWIQGHTQQRAHAGTARKFWGDLTNDEREIFHIAANMDFLGELPWAQYVVDRAKKENVILPPRPRDNE